MMLVLADHDVLMDELVAVHTSNLVNTSMVHVPRYHILNPKPETLNPKPQTLNEQEALYGPARGPFKRSVFTRAPPPPPPPPPPAKGVR